MNKWASYENVFGLKYEIIVSPHVFIILIALLYVWIV